MGIRNPMALRVERDGVTRDKYGREFHFDEKKFKRNRKKHVHPAVTSHEIGRD